MFISVDLYWKLWLSLFILATKKGQHDTKVEVVPLYIVFLMWVQKTVWYYSTHANCRRDNITEPTSICLFQLNKIQFII